jgi:hypothetical protein
MASTKPTIYSIELETGYIYHPTHYPIFTIAELKELKKSINKTLKRYAELGLDDVQIHKYNKDSCEDIMEEDIKGIKKVKKTNDTPTFIYIMIDHNTGFYKIGHSKNVLRRESTLQSEKPTIELLYTFEGIVRDERDLHDNFKELRVRGEWFALEKYMVDEIIKQFECKRISKEKRKQREGIS